MRDFTLQVYKLLCAEFKDQGYRYNTFVDYCAGKQFEKYVILRHDVDRNPESALRMAMVENQLGIEASYYFRVVTSSYDEDIIRRIRDLGHEIGYHYEDLSHANGSVQTAIESFKHNLTLLRKLYPVKTICMHGSPLSKWDNRLLWQHYDYHDFGIIGEPYLDVDFGEVLYLSDTGRCWNGEDVSIRDKVRSVLKYNPKSFGDILESLSNNELPTKLMLNIHPHRWNDAILPWFKELVWQNIKNIGKRFLIAYMMNDRKLNDI